MEVCRKNSAGMLDSTDKFLIVIQDQSNNNLPRGEGATEITQDVTEPQQAEQDEASLNVFSNPLYNSALSARKVHKI